MITGAVVSPGTGMSLSSPHEESNATASVPETMPHVGTNQADERSRLPIPQAVNDVLILRPIQANFFQCIICYLF